MKTLYLIRHGQTEWNVQKRMQGRLDSPLTEVGKSQANANGAGLKVFAQVDELVVSPSGRTRETAYILNSHLRAPVSYDDVLMERDCGDWSGLTMDEIAERFPEAWQARGDDPYSHRPPGGENFEDMIARVREFLDALFEKRDSEIALVTHGALSRAILAHFLELGPVELARVRHPNDLVYRLHFHPTHIETAHFVGGDGPRDGLLHQTDNETIARLDR
ncbi:MAG: histidine phosphatase family protein [Gammaproteobacteria bacterium]|nr:histidine phosphatase family protein [Gammaproteobacteria bacterium]